MEHEEQRERRSNLGSSHEQEGLGLKRPDD
jgi:hypothetical protein